MLTKKRTRIVDDGISGTVTAGPGSSPNARAAVTPGSRPSGKDANGKYSFNVPAGTHPSTPAAFPGRTDATATNAAVSDCGKTAKDFSPAGAATGGCLTDTDAESQSGVRDPRFGFTPGDPTNYNAASADASVRSLSAALSVSMLADRNPAPVGLYFNHKATDKYRPQLLPLKARPQPGSNAASQRA